MMSHLVQHDTVIFYMGISLFVFCIFLTSFFLFAWKFKKRIKRRMPKIERQLERQLEQQLNADASPVILSSQRRSITISSRDISAIAGGDVLTTQLDLARAYIETGRKQLAKKILHFVIIQGTEDQQAEAERLLKLV